MKNRKQYAALPYIVLTDHVEVMLITRRRSKRWIIPKGWPEIGQSAHGLAALEAYEEAGLDGRVGKRPIGRFSYIKKLHNKRKVRCRVDVYPLRVKAQYLDWPEKGQRELRWLKPKKAAALIEEKDLARLIKNFKPTSASKRTKNSTRGKLKARLTTTL